MKKLAKRPRAVIFDMDGVIIDSMPYHFLAWYEALRPHGVRVTCFDVYSKEGERWDKTLQELLTRSGIKPTKKLLKNIFEARQRIFRKYFRRFVFKGVREFLACLKENGHLLGLVTGTPHWEIKRILPRDIHRLFDCVVSGDSVKKGKPHPDPYLKAAALLRLKPSECLVIENAPYGIESAKAAHMRCVAVATSLPKEYLTKADFVVSDLSEISGLIDRSCRI